MFWLTVAEASCEIKSILQGPQVYSCAKFVVFQPVNQNLLRFTICLYNPRIALRVQSEVNADFSQMPEPFLYSDGCLKAA